MGSETSDFSHVIVCLRVRLLGTLQIVSLTVRSRSVEGIEVFRCKLSIEEKVPLDLDVGLALFNLISEVISIATLSC